MSKEPSKKKEVDKIEIVIEFLDKVKMKLPPNAKSGIGYAKSFLEKAGWDLDTALKDEKKFSVEFDQQSKDRIAGKSDPEP